MTYSADVLKLNPELAQATAYRVKAERVLKLGDGFDSQLERDFNAELLARGCTVRREGWTFHLPGGVDYTPDFVAWETPGVRYHTGVNLLGDLAVTIYEVKGDLKQKNARDSRTRFKIAAGLYPCFTFVWVTRNTRGQWRETEVRHD